MMAMPKISQRKFFSSQPRLFTTDTEQQRLAKYEKAYQDEVDRGELLRQQISTDLADFADLLALFSPQAPRSTRPRAS